MPFLIISLNDVASNLSRQDCVDLIEVCKGKIRKLDSMRLDSCEMAMVEDHRKIDAIRSLRSRTNLNLCEAKSVVDAYADTLNIPRAT